MKTNSAIRRNNAEKYILTSLVGFAVTVIVTRAFLEITGYPQIGNSVLHIAHALWGGLLLIIAAYLPLTYANRWAFQVSAVLSGIGVGLFIDEIGKFITQANDYFFPPALPLIYSFILMNALVYLYFRRSHSENARCVMYHVLDGLQDFLDGDMDAADRKRIMAQLAIAVRSERPEIVSIANVISEFLQQEKLHLTSGKVGFWKSISQRIDTVGRHLGRRAHHAVTAIVLIGWMILVAGFIVVLIRGGGNIDPQVLQWRVPLIGIQAVVGVLMSTGIYFWFTRREELGLKLGISGFLVSLVALQLLYFYISQFWAVTATLVQLTLLQILFAYRRWYLNDLALSDHQERSKNL